MLMDILENSSIIQGQFNLFLYTDNFMDDNTVVQINKWFSLVIKQLILAAQAADSCWSSGWQLLIKRMIGDDQGADRCDQLADRC